MNDQTKTPEGATPAEKAPPKEIIRGRMPVAVVALARFGSTKDSATKAQADAFGTTVGKIDDIRKNRNFAYVTAEFKPTAGQKADGIAWLERHPAGRPEALIAELQAMPEATAEEASAFEATRSASRGQSEKKADGGTADGGGGNRRGKGKKDAAAPAPAADAAKTGEALLS